MTNHIEDALAWLDARAAARETTKKRRVDRCADQHIAEPKTAAAATVELVEVADDDGEPVTAYRCALCGETKPVGDFYSSNTTYCKPCRKIKRREEYLAAGGKDVPYDQLLRRQYGITLADYNAMLRRQAHRCAICRRPETVRMKRTGELRRLAVDHDHVTGAIRGLLCQRCNTLVWALEDNHASLAAIAAYIEEFRNTFANGVPL